MRTAAIMFSVLVVLWLVPGFVGSPAEPRETPAPTAAMPGDKLDRLLNALDTAYRIPRSRLADTRSPDSGLVDPITGTPFSGFVLVGEPDREPVTIAEFRHGLPHGATLGLYADRSIAFVRHHVRGVPFGRVLEYDEQGLLRLDAIGTGNHPHGGVRLEQVRGAIGDKTEASVARCLGFRWWVAIRKTTVSDDADFTLLALAKHRRTELQ